MDLVRTRRRGAELEEALLDAAWKELKETGYPAFTYDGVAARAGTSKPVLYRRWPAKLDLVLAALRHSGLFVARELADTGSLRDDMFSELVGFSRRRASFVAIMSVYTSQIYEDLGLSPADLRERLFGESRDIGRKLLERAAERGEIPARDWPDAITKLPTDLLRHDMIMTLKAISEARIRQIVDDIWIPLVQQECPARQG